MDPQANNPPDDSIEVDVYIMGRYQGKCKLARGSMVGTFLFGDAGAFISKLINLQKDIEKRNEANENPKN